MNKFWEALEGWKVRIWSLFMLALGLTQLLTPDLVSRALGLGDRGEAITMIVFAIGTAILREMTTGPTAPMPKIGKK